MSQYELEKLAKYIANYLLLILEKKHELANDKPRYLKTKEAAAVVNRSVAWMRKHKDEFPHKKLGDGAKQGQLLFLEDALYKFPQ